MQPFCLDILFTLVYTRNVCVAADFTGRKAISSSINIGVNYTFKSWERRRRHISPEADRLLPLIAASTTGLTRVQIGHAVDIERDVLDELLAGMVGVGLLMVSRDARGPVYRSPISAA